MRLGYKNIEEEKKPATKMKFGMINLSHFWYSKYCFNINVLNMWSQSNHS